jgi:hypothetical protein
MFMNLEGAVINYLMERDNLSLEQADYMWREIASEIFDAIYGTSCMSLDEVLENNLGITLEDLMEESV